MELGRDRRIWTPLIIKSYELCTTPAFRSAAAAVDGAPAPLQLLEVLYADPEVSAVLRRFRVPRRPNPGSIADRFPVPVRLTVGLLRALYLDVGLSARQIELLTGEPFEQVLDALHAAAIPVRREVGWSPWLVRQRT